MFHHDLIKLQWVHVGSYNTGYQYTTAESSAHFRYTVLHSTLRSLLITELEVQAEALRLSY